MSNEELDNFSNSVNNDQRVSSRQRIYIGFTKTGSDMFSVFFVGALFGFYVDILHMNPQSYGVVLIIFAVWNAVNDPIFGYMSDKKRLDKRGKRTFFIRLSTPIYFIGYTMFWLAFPSWSQTWLFIFLLISLFIFDTGLTIAGLNISALQIDQTTSTNERTRIMLISMLVSLLPVGIASLAPNLILTSTTLSNIDMSLIFIAGGIVAAIFMGFGAYKLKEHSLEKEGTKPLPIFAAIKETLKSKSFIFFVIFSFMMNAVTLNLVAIIPLYFKYVFMLNGIEVLIVSVVTGVVYIPLLFVYEKLQKRYGLRNSFFIAIILMIIGCLGLFFSKSIVLMAFSYGLCLWMAALWWLLVNPMVGDIADEDELKTNNRREGMFFGTNALITKPASSLIIFVFTAIIDFYGYDSHLDIQSSEALFGIRLGIGILPLAFLVLAFIALYFYPLHGRKLKQVKMNLNNLHSKRKV
ncbi:MAG: MFS transporter [Candidatus Heimdallarchaeota archaeon]|nr:MFS transporter [Candidatus Heimdallarchaeota archaeon]MCG3257272.1 MFS transporter [Candidatus Heimdallarchaeota archaeon]MCK4612329.1 MFS transporter [Candidatus Heimdallarchaeota archaeon]